MKWWLGATGAIGGALGLVDELFIPGANSILMAEFASAGLDDLVRSWGPDGQRWAWVAQGLDTVFPFVYGRLGWLLLVRYYPATGGWHQAVCALPVVAAALDLIENAGLAAALLGFGGFGPLVTGFATAKFLCLVLAAVGLAAGLVSSRRVRGTG